MGQGITGAGGGDRMQPNTGDIHIGAHADADADADANAGADADADAK